jgi:hypothetical protein
MTHDLKLTAIYTVAGCFLSITILLLVYTIFSSVRMRYKLNRKEIYNTKIEKSVFAFLFSDQTVHESLTPLLPHLKDSLFRKLCVKTLVLVRSSYTAETADKACTAYTFLELHKYSEEKLNSILWQHKVEAIRDITILRHAHSINKIKPLLLDRHKSVRTEAFIAIMTLGNAADKSELASVDVDLDDWSQSVLLQRLQQNRITDQLPLQTFLDSRNERLVLFGIRAVLLFKRSELYGQLREIAVRHPELFRQFTHIENTVW